MPYKDKNGKFCGFLNAEEKEGSGKFLRRYFLLDEKKSRLYYYKDNPGVSDILSKFHALYTSLYLVNMMVKF